MRCRIKQLTLHDALAVTKQGKPISTFLYKGPPETPLYLDFTHNIVLNFRNSSCS